ncbi:MAG: NADAR family protein [Bacteroidetes bacterium]|nr:NADAR family protein [Bacteroidota bacterium]
MEPIHSKNQERIYKIEKICVFRKTKELFGGLSNMASGFPLKINGISILTSEALYQACRFPHMPDVQKKICLEKSPMSAKMVSKPFRSQSRKDWDNVRVDIMYWCLKVKLAQNFVTFGQLLEKTCNKPIVEESIKDPFWDAIRDKENESILKGTNTLGCLLMKLRQEYNSEKRYELLYVEPLNIPNFLFYGEPIQIVDERHNFIEGLYKFGGIKPKSDKQETKNIQQIEKKVFEQPEIIVEPEVDCNGQIKLDRNC